MSQQALELLLTRRSVKAAMLTEPGPDPTQLAAILTAAARVPDHKSLVPWRFILFEGGSRNLIGESIADIFRSDRPDATPDQIAFENGRFHRSRPCVRRARWRCDSLAACSTFQTICLRVQRRSLPCRGAFSERRV